MFVDARKAHLNLICEDDIYIELPEECRCGPGKFGKLNSWLYGFRPAAAAWEKLYAEKSETASDSHAEWHVEFNFTTWGEIYHEQYLETISASVEWRESCNGSEDSWRRGLKSR